MLQAKDLQIQAQVIRDQAAQARRLAQHFSLESDRGRMIGYAEDLEAKAAWLEAQAAEQVNSARPDGRQPSAGRTD